MVVLQIVNGWILDWTLIMSKKSLSFLKMLNDRSEPKHIFAHDGDRDGVQFVAEVDTHGKIIRLIRLANRKQEDLNDVNSNSYKMK